MATTIRKWDPETPWARVDRQLGVGSRLFWKE